MKKRILVIGSIFTDFIMHIDKVPLANEVTLEYGPRETVAGGVGFNLASAFSKLGADTVLCTKVGADPQGAALLRSMSNFKIDKRFAVEDARGKSGFNAVLAESNGIIRTASYPGVAYDISETDAEEAMTCYPDAVYTSLEMPSKTIVAAADIAEENGIPIFLEGGPADTRFPFSRLPRLEAFICNMEQTQAYTRINPDTLDNCLRAALKLSGIVDAKYYVIKLGDRGCYTYDGTYQHICPTDPIIALDKRGAGEAFGAALTLAYLESGDIEGAMKYANLASAVAISKPGRCAAYPTNAEIEKYYKQHEFN